MKTENKDLGKFVMFGKRKLPVAPTKKGEIPQTSCKKDTQVFGHLEPPNCPLEDLAELLNK